MMVANYLRERYNETLWEYYGVNQLLYDLREHGRKNMQDELRELRLKGAIEPCQGINGWLVRIKDVNLLL
jgi:hypothetical protein